MNGHLKYSIAGGLAYAIRRVAGSGAGLRVKRLSRFYGNYRNAVLQGRTTGGPALFFFKNFIVKENLPRVVYVFLNRL